MRRYSRTNRVKGGRQFGTAKGATAIYYAVQSGRIASTRRITREGDRLDVIAGQLWGDSTLWWVIAASSGIGWGAQVPPGIVLKIPVNLEEILLYVG